MHKLAIAVIASLLLPIATAQSTTYQDPQGRFDINVPEGWRAAPDDGVDQIVLRKGAVSVTVSVQRQNKSNAMTAKQYVDGVANEFRGQCPTFLSRKSGALTLAGTPGLFEIFTCSDPKSPAVAEADAALTSDPIIISVTMIAPLARYYESLPTLNAIRHSLYLKGQKPPPPLADDAKADLDSACLVGAFSATDCTRRFAELNADPAGPTPLSGNVYHDAQGRFMLQVPKGWTATAEGDNGTAGVQLRSGANWINVMPAEGSVTATEVVLSRERRIAEESHLDRKPPFGTIGIVQLFGNGIEVDFDHFSGSSLKGEAVESYVAGVGPASAGSAARLLVFASLSSAHAGEDLGATFLGAAQSIRFPSH